MLEHCKSSRFTPTRKAATPRACFSMRCARKLEFASRRCGPFWTRRQSERSRFSSCRFPITSTSRTARRRISTKNESSAISVSEIGEAQGEYGTEFNEAAILTIAEMRLHQTGSAAARWLQCVTPTCRRNMGAFGVTIMSPNRIPACTSSAIREFTRCAIEPKQSGKGLPVRAIRRPAECAEGLFRRCGRDRCLISEEITAAPGFPAPDWPAARSAKAGLA